MITYEVTATVSDTYAPAYETYMRDRHIPDVLATGCFTGAAIARAEDGRYRIRYEVADQATLDRYLAEHAPRLRRDFSLHFPREVELTRAVWETLEEWPGRA